MSLDFLLTWGCVLPKFGPPDVAFLASTLPLFQCIPDMDINNTQCETTSKSPNHALISMFSLSVTAPDDPWNLWVYSFAISFASGIEGKP